MIRSMRALLVWASAAIVALGLLRRIFRGEVVVLSSHAAPVIRLLAIALVFVAGCVEKLRPAVASGPDSEDMSQGTVTQSAAPVVAPAQRFPAELDDAGLTAAYAAYPPRTLASQFMDESLGGPRSGDGGRIPELAAEIVAHRERAAAGQPETAATLTALLDAAERVHVYDAWLPAHLWQHARALVPAPSALFARLERHLRICHALVVGQTVTGPLEFSAWRSKAGPPRGWTGVTVPPGLAAAARDSFEDGVDAGTWDSEAALELTVVRGQPRLLRRDGAAIVAVGAALRLRRLDVVRADAAVVLRHASLGELTLPAGGELTAWNVGDRLGSVARARVQVQVEQALAGDESALTALESILPAAHAAIRVGVAAKPNAPGAAGLRMLLTGFDE